MSGRGGRPRDFFARFVAARGGVRDPRIAAAFAATRREIFAGPGPWQIRAGDGYLETPDDDPAHLYQDVLVALDAARGINIGEPSLHARCHDALAPRAGEEALHVGADTGCYTAVLARLVGPRGRVTALEIDPGFAARTSRNLADLSWVRVEAASGAGRRLPEFDAVCVSAGAMHPDAAWLAALCPGARLLFPMQPAGVGAGCCWLGVRPRRLRAGRRASSAGPGSSPCAGVQDEAAGRRLADAFESEAWRRVRSLRFDVPDDTCRVAGEGWFLSTAPTAAPDAGMEPR